MGVANGRVNEVANTCLTLGGYVTARGAIQNEYHEQQP